MTTICVGVSHKQAPIAVRERLAVPADKLPEKLQQLKSLPGVREAMVISTCNRLEIFATTASREIAEDIVESLDPAAGPLAACRFDDDALHHLFRVAASLDSMVVGEAQILGQVKEAAAAAQAAGTLGSELQKAVARASTAAKRVRTETEIARGAVSISSVAAELAKKLLGELAGRSVLLLGAGEMAQLAARELRSQGTRELLVANRNSQRAEELAREVDGVPVSLGELPSLLERADVVICSTGADHHIVTRELMAKAIKARRYRPLFLVDISLPRNVEPAVNEIDSVYLYDLDDLERVAAQNRELRAAQVSKAEEIVLDELRTFLAKANERRSVPVLGLLRQQAEAIARAEAEKTLTALAGLDERQQKSVRAMASAIVNKLLHAPTAKLRAEAGQGPLAEAAMQLFALAEAASAEPERPDTAQVIPMAVGR
ncbi:MAG TPA: glutamyl-tRNA reductase [Myxococcales bacterium]|nr:glutamyl-tRNA reductase [Myxococcales bacterium]